jgi:hypothetical protein
VVRRDDYLVESQGSEIGVERRVWHDADNDVRILFFYGSSQTKDFQGKTVPEARENLDFFLDRIKIENVVSSFVAYEKNFVSHSGKLIG